MKSSRKVLRGVERVTAEKVGREGAKQSRRKN